MKVHTQRCRKLVNGEVKVYDRIVVETNLGLRIYYRFVSTFKLKLVR